jgi:hypothetical protein
LRKELHDDSPSLIPHPKKSKRISLKVKERVRKPNQTAEERQIAKSKDNEKHICTYTRTKKKKNTKRDLPPHRHLLVIFPSACITQNGQGN